MNPTRRRRVWFVAALLAAAALAATLVTHALQRNITYLYTPHEVLAQGADALRSGDTRFRLGGMVESGSLRREKGSLVSHFRVTDGDAQLEVTHDKILPDLFREGQSVVATGRMRDGVFVAEQVLAKHDETYVPKEVADKMGLAHEKHGVETPASGKGTY